MGLDDQFAAAQVKVKTLPNQSNENLLKLYSLYKQATSGDVGGKKPGMFDLVAKAKHEAWSSLKGMSQEKAKQEYVKLVGSLASK